MENGLTFLATDIDHGASYAVGVSFTLDGKVYRHGVKCERDKETEAREWLTAWAREKGWHG
jgi:hypothetical protein